MPCSPAASPSVPLLRAPRLVILLLATAVAGLFGPVGSASAAAKKKPVIKQLRCVPATKSGCGATPKVAIGERVRFSGRNFKKGMRVTFRWNNGALATKLRVSRAGWTAEVPPGTKLGTIRVYLTDSKKRRSNQRKVRVVAAPSDPNAGKPVTTIKPARGTAPEVFRGDGMWIWELPKAEGGNVDRIAARAKVAGIKTVFVKSSDAGNVWSQFSPALISGLKARGLNVCGWQFVYGKTPSTEAKAAIANVRAGADCFVIDAETHYEGRYASASRYMRELRGAIGDDYPLGLTSFPYVDYHPKLPYSVFMNPEDGAQVNIPQVYWRDIGGSVDAVSAKTVAENRIYGVAIAPLGQTYNNPTPSQLSRFRAVWKAYGAPGLSWWSWQHTPSSLWNALGEPAEAAPQLSDPGWPALSNKSSGDQVIWLQMHLKAFRSSLPVTGTFGSSTTAALKEFQGAKGLPETGTTDAATWTELLKLQAASVDWS